MRTLVIALLLAVPALAQDYHFEQVKRKVALNDAPAAKGQKAKGGDSVETGWFSYALIAAEQARAKFEIFSATEVKLAEGTPGVILSVERGRIRAAFDKITGSEPRVVKTPGALLAVRGTQFDVRVSADGETTVDVWEGLVEIRSPLQPEPLFVGPGQESAFGRQTPPVLRPMPEHRRREDPNRPRDRSGEGGMHSPDGHGDPHGSGGHNPPPPPPPPTGGHHGMPQKPPDE